MKWHEATIFSLAAQAQYNTRQEGFYGENINYPNVRGVQLVRMHLRQRKGQMRCRCVAATGDSKAWRITNKRWGTLVGERMEKDEDGRSKWFQYRSVHYERLYGRLYNVV